MIWTTSVFSLQERHLTSLRSYLYFYPLLAVRIYISDWRPIHWTIVLDDILRRGYHLELIRLDEAFFNELICDPNPNDQSSCQSPCQMAWEWIKAPIFKSGVYYYSHLTDLLRFCLLLREGGIYSDFDAILLRPLPYWPDEKGKKEQLILGKDWAGDNEPPCNWCLRGTAYYTAPGLMMATAGASWLAKALLAFQLSRYNPAVFNGVGPKAITEAISNHGVKDGLTILDPFIFYPVNYLESPQLFSRHRKLDGIDNDDDNKDDEISRAWLEHIERKAISLHFFGGRTRHLKVNSGSIMDILQRRFQFNNNDQLTVPPYMAIANISDECIKLVGVNWRGERPVKIETSLRSDDGKITLKTCQGQTTAELNFCLQQKVQYCPGPSASFDVVQFQVSSTTVSTINSFLPTYHLPRLVTVLVKTMDRMAKVIDLVASFRRYYGPHISLLVANDGLQAARESEGFKRGFYLMPLPYDVGLSAARNILLQKATTPLVFLVDDDFIFTEDSDLAYLVHQVMRQYIDDKAFNNDVAVDIAAAKSPADMDAHGLDYSGTLRYHQKTLWIEPITRGRLPDSTCHRVDIVPNIFVGRTAVLQKIGWDETLKVGEHEDFFFRAQAAGLRVVTCRSVSLLHRQEPHWKLRTTYDRLRARVWYFLSLALRKHGLCRLVAFNRITIALQPLNHQDIVDLRVTDLQPFAAHLHWRIRNVSNSDIENQECADNQHKYHIYQVDVLDITEVPDEHPGHLLQTIDVTPSDKDPLTPRAAYIMGLDPERYYRLVVRPGNHTDISPLGPELIIRTPPYYSPTNLILNGDFDGNDEWWKRTLSTNFGLTPVVAAIDEMDGHKTYKVEKPSDNHNTNSNDNCDAIPARPGPFAQWRLRSAIVGDYAASVYVGGGKREPGQGAIYQIIPAQELPPHCQHQPCQVSLAAWCRIDRLHSLGFPSSKTMAVQLQVRFFWSDGLETVHGQDFDPEQVGRWQCLAFSVGLDLRNRKVGLLKLEVWARLMTPHGSVAFDDFYLAVRPISGDGTI